MLAGFELLFSPHVLLGVLARRVARKNAGIALDILAEKSPVFEEGALLITYSKPCKSLCFLLRAFQKPLPAIGQIKKAHGRSAECRIDLNLSLEASN